MLRSVIYRNPLTVTARNINAGPKVGLFLVRFNSSFDQLKNVVNQNSAKDNSGSNSSTIDTIDNLLSETSNNANKLHFNNKSDDYIFGNSIPHPRDVAKNIRLHGAIAGRTVDVQYGNFGRALSGVNSVIRNNKVRYLQKVQNRFIPPAKYAKQKKREWWRRRFSQGFKDLMSQVRDAKRRGY